MEPNSTTNQPPRSGILRMIAFILAPFVVAAACIGFGALALGTLGERAVFALLQTRADTAAVRPGIPVTGGELPAPDGAPRSEQPLQPPDSPGYLILAQEHMSACYDSFGAFVDLEQLVFEEPGLFQDEEYRLNAQEAADLFREDCQALHSLPEAPAAYQELDLWLRRSAEEAGLAAESFKSALDAGRAGVFSSNSMHMTVEHLLNFIDYTHNAASVLESLSERKDL